MFTSLSSSEELDDSDGAGSFRASVAVQCTTVPVRTTELGSATVRIVQCTTVPVRTTELGSTTVRIVQCTTVP